ncbi:hypothetical protein IWX65_002710 [Arthrobacter sp. CAN_A214]|uniref:hypothetical protein n=1 Tax=Arthrobacter sp. CAN_A214 TaxID=2787720 RepID=UPI0018CAD5BE
MTAKKAAWMAFAIGAVLILAFYFLQNTQGASQQAGAGAQTSPAAADQKQAAAEDASDATATAEPTLDSPAGVDRGNGFAQASPDAAQAPVQPTPAQYERQEITAPPVPTPDMQDPAAVAGAFLTVYNSRTSETDESWKGTTEPWLVPDLAAQLPLVPNGALEGKTPAAVRTVEVGENVEDWGIDTPLRWAHHVQVTVDTQDQGSYLLEYRLRSQLTDQGWLINAAPLDSWQRVKD